jgi:hypothetical protein
MPFGKSPLHRRNGLSAEKQTGMEKKEVLIMVKIAPSVLSADFANLERDIRRIDAAEYVHLDVMDGIFVPNITIGIPVLKSRAVTRTAVLDVHLMIDRPVRYVEAVLQSGRGHSDLPCGVRHAGEYP